MAMIKEKNEISSDAGFSYIDTMIALVILLVGILGVLAGLTGGILQSRSQDEQMLAKQVAASTMEAIMSVKETDRPVVPGDPPDAKMGWDAIGNVGTNPDDAGVFQGKFVVGEQPVRSGAGADNIVGTGDDTGAIVPGVTREIIITDVCDQDRPSYNCSPPGDAPIKIRSVQVIVRYFAGTIEKQEVLRTVVSDYAKPIEATP
jgi:type II secretory pathway pseudopilin PulG